MKLATSKQWLEKSGHKFTDEEIRVFDQIVEEITEGQMTATGSVDINEARIYALMGFIE
jgi:hypothetical protein